MQKEKERQDRMENNKRSRIYNLLSKMNDDDRNALCCLLIKSGYTARIGKERPNNKGQYIYFVEYWKEENDANS